MTGNQHRPLQSEGDADPDTGAPDPQTDEAETDPRVGVQLAETLDAAARELLTRNGEGVEHTLELIVAGALSSIPHVDRAGISLLEGGIVTAHAPSDHVAAELDALQNTLGEGPCRDAIAGQERILVPDMSAADEQWPRFAPAALERGVAAMVSFQLFAQNGSAGSLNLYSADPEVFDESSLDAGSLFASHAAIALHGAQRIDGLHYALRSRDVIGMAKGILVERFSLTEGAAFAMLVRSSQDTNVKLHAVAEWLVDEATRGRGGPPTR